jgi:formate dehydrogenase
LSGARTRDDIIKVVSDAGLRGLGGAGFPTGRKWTLVRAEPRRG